MTPSASCHLKLVNNCGRFFSSGKAEDRSNTTGKVAGRFFCFLSGAGSKAAGQFFCFLSGAGSNYQCGNIPVHSIMALAR